MRWIPHPRATACLLGLTLAAPAALYAGSEEVVSDHGITVERFETHFGILYDAMGELAPLVDAQMRDSNFYPPNLARTLAGTAPTRLPEGARRGYGAPALFARLSAADAQSRLLELKTVLRATPRNIPNAERVFDIINRIGAIIGLEAAIRSQRTAENVSGAPHANSHEQEFDQVIQDINAHADQLASHAEQYFPRQGDKLHAQISRYAPSQSAVERYTPFDARKTSLNNSLSSLNIALNRAKLLVNQDSPRRRHLLGAAVNAEELITAVEYRMLHSHPDPPLASHYEQPPDLPLFTDAGALASIHDKARSMVEDPSLLNNGRTRRLAADPRFGTALFQELLIAMRLQQYTLQSLQYAGYLEQAAALGNVMDGLAAIKDNLIRPAYHWQRRAEILRQAKHLVQPPPREYPLDHAKIRAELLRIYETLSGALRRSEDRAQANDWLQDIAWELPGLQGHIAAMLARSQQKPASPTAFLPIDSPAPLSAPEKPAPWLRKATMLGLATLILCFLAVGAVLTALYFLGWGRPIPDPSPSIGPKAQVRVGPSTLVKNVPAQ